MFRADEHLVFHWSLYNKSSRLNAKLSKKVLLACDDSRKGPRVRDNQPNCNTRPFFIGQETSIVAKLEHSPQTNKTKEMPCDRITLCFRLSFRHNVCLF